MKLTSTFLLFLIFSIPISFVSCGDSDDSGGDNITVNTPPQEEETPTTGGATGGGGGGTSCLTTTQRSNITALLDRLSAESPIGGLTTAIVNNDDGTTSTGSFPGTAFSFGRATDTSWAIAYALCPTTEPEDCRSSISTAAFRDGCFYFNDVRAVISSSSQTNLAYSATLNGVRVQTTLSHPSSGNFRYSETYSENGRRTLRLTFVETDGPVLFMEALLESLKPQGDEGIYMRDALPIN